MTNCYPSAILNIYEFNSIIDGEYPEFDLLSTNKEQIVQDAYLLTMSEDRITQWENQLGIIPVAGSTLDDRRETIIAKLVGKTKLNTQTIKAMVKTFTTGDCNVWFDDSTIHVEMLPSPEPKRFILDNLIAVLTPKIPAHLQFEISYAYRFWEDVKADDPNWNAVNELFNDWEAVLYGYRRKPNELDKSRLDIDYYLG